MQERVSLMREAVKSCFTHRAGRQDDDDGGDGLRRLLAALPGLLHHRIRLSRHRLLPVHPGEREQASERALAVQTSLPPFSVHDADLVISFANCNAISNNFERVQKSKSRRGFRKQKEAPSFYNAPQNFRN